MTGTDQPNTGRPFEELRSTGLLWLVNRVVFHPRGYALAFHRVDGQITGWSLQGDGSEPWTFGCGDEDRHFTAVEALFAQARAEVLGEAAQLIVEHRDRHFSADATEPAARNAQTGGEHG